MHRLLYLVLGAPDSGRKAIVRDLIEGGLTNEESAQIFTNEMTHDTERVSTWDWENEAIILPEEAKESTDRHQFLILSPYIDLADQIEASIDLLAIDNELILARILLVVHCGLLEETSPQLRKWHEACLHFTDVVLLNRREGVNQKLIEELKDHYESMHLPVVLEYVRRDRIANPAKILDPTPRRLTQLFETEEDLDLDFIDEYLERLPSGDRAKQIPLPFGEQVQFE